MTLLFLLAVRSSATDTGAAPVVDHHVHYFSPEVVAAIEERGFEFAHSDYQFSAASAFYDLDEILRENAAGKSVLLSGGFNYDYEDEDEKRRAIARENDRLAAAVREHPDRLYGLCGLDPLAASAEEEARRCAEELDLHGIKLHLPISGVDLTREDHRSKMKNLLAVCAERRIPILIHNSTTGLSGDEYAQLFIATFLDELDGLTLIFAHAGGGSSYRDFTVDFLVAFSEYLRSGASRRRHDVYFELSAFLADGRVPRDAELDALVRAIDAIGSDRFLFGSDYPMRSAERYLEELQRRLDLAPEVLDRILRRDVLGTTEAGSQLLLEEGHRHPGDLSD